MVAGRTLHRAIGSTTGGVVVALALGLAEMPVAAEADHVIQLTQTGCQFLEPEKGVDGGFEPRSAEDCNRINAETGGQRLANAKILELSPGTYTFRVTNTDVPYELGLWLREADYQLGNPLHKLTKLSVSGGGLYEGQTKDYTVDLDPGSTSIPARSIRPPTTSWSSRADRLGPAGTGSSRTAQRGGRDLVTWVEGQTWSRPPKLAA